VLTSSNLNMSSSTSDAGTLTPRIPSPPKIVDFHTNLSLMKQQGHTNIELLDWLKQYGITTSSVTLERRLRKTRSRLWDQPRSQRQHLWPLPKAGQRQVKGPHKRQISEAIPRAEREVARVPRGAAKEVAKVPEEAAEAVVDGLRKSARPHKPKSRS
jgi:hypothetical protein